MPIAIDDVIQVTYQGVVFDQKVLTVLHMRCSTAPAGSPTTESVLQAIADYFSSPTQPLTMAYIAAAHPSFVLTRVRAQRVKPTRSIYFEALIGSNGTEGNAPPSANVAISIEKRSLNTTRRGIGRVQFPAPPIEAIASGYVQDPWLTGVGLDFAQKLYGTVSVTGLYASDYRWCLPAGGADHGYDIWDAVIKDTVRTMHRRTVGLGI